MHILITQLRNSSGQFMKLTHSVFALILSTLIVIHSIYTFAETSSWLILLIQYFVIFYYFGHFTLALFLVLSEVAYWYLKCSTF